MDKLFYEINEKLPRQGPGNVESTRKAFSFIPDLPYKPLILDIGCGSGVQTIELAKLSNGNIMALDDHQPFLSELQEKAALADVTDRIECVQSDMFSMNLNHGTFDLIWAEGSIFVPGFEKGLQTWKSFLKANGFMAVTDVNWLKEDPPIDLRHFWDDEYPEMTYIENYIEIINSTGYQLIDHFILPEHAWWDDYYEPMEITLQTFRKMHHDDQKAQKIIAYMQKEIDLYRVYSDYYGYVFYIMQWVD